jgi:sodium transport system permease protein
MLKPTAHIFRKEMREMLRDRRVLTSAVVGPIFLMVVMVLLFGFLQDSLSKPKPQTIYVVGSLPTGQTALKPSAGLIIKHVDSVEAGKGLIREGKAKLVVAFRDLGVAERGQEPPKAVDAYFNPEEPLSGLAMQAVRRGVQEFNKVKVGAILAANGVSKEMAEPMRLVEKPVRTSKGLGSAMIVGMIPYLIVIWAFYGGFSVVTELVTGEKEKNTLETLLITPVSRQQIALGKFWALCCVCLTSSLMSLLCLIAMGLMRLPMTTGLFPDGVSASPLMLLGVAAVLLPLVALFAGVLLSISTFARNTREAQTHLTLVSFLVLMPAIFSQFIGYTDFAHAPWVPFVPILNSATCIKDALMGKFDGTALSITIGTSLVLAAMSMRWAIWMFGREQVLTRV